MTGKPGFREPMPPGEVCDVAAGADACGALEVAGTAAWAIGFPASSGAWRGARPHLLGVRHPPMTFRSVC